MTITLTQPTTDQLLGRQAMLDLERGEHADDVRYQLTARGALEVGNDLVDLRAGLDAPVDFQVCCRRWIATR